MVFENKWVGGNYLFKKNIPTKTTLQESFFYLKIINQ
jgi:hypothetical protein